MKIKKTSPSVKVRPIGKYTPSCPQNAQPQGVGGTKARMRHKGRVAPKASDPHDPGPYKRPPSNVHWPTSDKKAQKGYVTGKSWPKLNKSSGAHSDTVSVTAPHS